MRFLDVQGDLETPSLPAISAADCPPNNPPENPGRNYSPQSSPIFPASGFEGAQISDQRSGFFAFPINCRREMSSYTRKELIRKVRALDANLGIFGRIKQKVRQQAVGAGIFVRPITRDKTWNDLNRKRFEKKAENPLLYSVEETYDFYEDQGFAAESLVGDGESLTALVEGEDKRLCTQRFDPFEVESPRPYAFGQRLPDGTYWQDGVRVSFLDAPRTFGLRELPRFGFATGFGGLFPPETVREVPAAAFLHVFHHRRAHQTRGITWFYSGINNGIDALDMVSLEKGTAKLHSLLALAVRKKKGDAGKTGISGALSKLAHGDKGVTRVEENFWRGAAIAYLAEDEGIDLLASDRPSANLLAFLEFLYREISTALGLPLEVIYNLAELGGASVRAVLEDAQALFDIVTDKIVMRHSRRYYIWDTANAMLSGELPMCEDPEWWASAWRGPTKLTVDLGRTADAAVKLMKNAALSHIRYYEERNQDAYNEMEEEIQFRGWLRERCKQAGVEYSELIEPTPGAVTNVHVQPSDNSPANL